MLKTTDIYDYYQVSLPVIYFKYTYADQTLLTWAMKFCELLKHLDHYKWEYSAIAVIKDNLSQNEYLRTYFFIFNYAFFNMYISFYKSYTQTTDITGWMIFEPWQMCLNFNTILRHWYAADGWKLQVS